MTNARPPSDLALDALGDATRRAIVRRLSEAPATVGGLAAALPVSRPAVSQHLKVLREAGLVSVERRGTAAVHSLDAAGLGGVRDWIDSLWDEALEAFAEAARHESKGRR